MGAENDLVGLYWTISGPVEVHFGREWSLFDLADRCAHAERAGFKGIGIWHADLEHVLQTRTLPEIKALLDAHGLEYLELEFIWEWFLPPDDERRRARRADASGCSTRRRPRSARTTSRSGTSRARRASCPASIEAYAELCAEAAAAARRADGLRVHAAGRQRPRPRHGARAGRGRSRAERRARDRHLAPREARDRGGRPAANPGPPARLGRALRRAVGEHGRPASTR